MLCMLCCIARTAVYSRRHRSRKPCSNGDHIGWSVQKQYPDEDERLLCGYRNCSVRSEAVEQRVVALGMCAPLLTILDTPHWPNCLRDCAAGLLQSLSERWDNVHAMGGLRCCLPPPPLTSAPALCSPTPCLNTHPQVTLFLLMCLPFRLSSSCFNASFLLGAHGVHLTGHMAGHMAGHMGCT